MGAHREVSLKDVYSFALLCLQMARGAQRGVLFTSHLVQYQVPPPTYILSLLPGHRAA